MGHNIVLPGPQVNNFAQVLVRTEMQVPALLTCRTQKRNS